ncbi:HNH endonuclease [Pseudovibrio ascidiaceicola]|uniref:HNH endonuclease n=1 Tax=Pseudovibrio ascidiaceicola TaxID=285279 RepID=UPI000D69DA26|nr:hypothetical protein [Pseudovibrio ascidiaceicola]
MIEETVSYSEKHQAIIDAYENGELDGNYWRADEVRPIAAIIRAHYLRQQDGRCCYCDREITTNAYVQHVEHIVCRSTDARFMFTPHNLAVACSTCNGRKNAKAVLTREAVVGYPGSSGAFSIVHPHFDEYEEHISRIGDDIYAPLTPKGTETIKLCELTRFVAERLERGETIEIQQTLSDFYDEINNGSYTKDQNKKLTMFMMKTLKLG